MARCIGQPVAVSAMVSFFVGLHCLTLSAEHSDAGEIRSAP